MSAGGKCASTYLLRFISRRFVAIRMLWLRLRPFSAPRRPRGRMPFRSRCAGRFLVSDTVFQCCSQIDDRCELLALEGDGNCFAFGLIFDQFANAGLVVIVKFLWFEGFDQGFCKLLRQRKLLTVLALGRLLAISRNFVNFIGVVQSVNG